MHCGFGRKSASVSLLDLYVALLKVRHQIAEADVLPILKHAVHGCHPALLRNYNVWIFVSGFLGHVTDISR
jgi:hypothetical protein